MYGIRFALVGLVAAAALGCSTLKGVQKGLQETTNNQGSRLTPEEQREKYHDSLVGLTEDGLIEEVGAPAKVEEIGSFKIFHYYTDRGISSTGSSYATAVGHGAMTSGNSTSVAHFQLSRFYLKGGKVVKWDYSAK